MVGHEAVGQEAHARLLTALLEQFEKRRVVAVLGEDLHAAVAAIEDVVDHVSGRDSSATRHGGEAYPVARARSIRWDVPLLMLSPF